jgi:hypothetical protein
VKVFKTFLLLTLLAAIGLIADLVKQKPTEELLDRSVVNSVKHAYDSRTAYDLDVKFNNETNSLNVSEVINWKNIDSILVESLFINLPKQFDKSSDDNYSFSSFKINSFLIDGNPTQYEYYNELGKNFLDSTLAKVVLQKCINQNESISIEINYDIIFLEDKKFSESNFYNFENWYITIAPYLSGQFEKYPLHKFIEPFLEYSDYNIKIKIPKEFKIATSGKVEEKLFGESVIYNCSAKGISRFNWFAFNELSKHSRKINLGDSSVDVSLFIKVSKDGYVERYFDASEKYLNTLQEYAQYPMEDLIIVDIPNINNLNNKSYPNLIANKSDLISPLKTQKLEYNLALQLTRQYFQNIVNSNYLEESWLSIGISAFVAEKLVREHFGEQHSYFNVADYYPIYGLSFMSIAGIPLIYTISEHVIPEGARYIQNYYSSLTFSDLSIPSYKLPSYDAFVISTIAKPQIALMTIEKFIGAEKLKSKLKKYFQSNLFKHTTSLDFQKIICNELSLENQKLYEQLFTSDKIFDYSISYIEKRDANKYDIMLERIGSGVTPIQLSIYRELDTLQINWDGKERYKIFTINSDTEIISAEIDAEKKNMLDLNFANNSYIVEEQYWGTISYSTRVFFWFQNALMLIGGKG